MAACPLVDLLVYAQLAAGGGRHWSQAVAMTVAWGCYHLPSSFGNIKGKLDLLWGCQGLSLQKGDQSCAQRPVTGSGMEQGTGRREKLGFSGPALEQSV